MYTQRQMEHRQFVSSSRGVHKMKSLIKIIILLFVGLLAACSGGKGKDTSAVLARVNEIDITVDQRERRVAEIQAQYQAQGMNIPEEQMFLLRSDIVDALIEEAAVAVEIERLGIKVNEDDIAAEINNVRQQFQSAQEYYSALEAQGLSEQLLKDDIRKSLAMGLLMEQEVFSKMKISEDEMMEFYLENSEYFEIQETVAASHILIRVDENADSKDVEAARNKILGLKKQLDNGADFAELAKVHSEDTSGVRGGHLGTFTVGQMVEPFENAAFALEPGEISDPVRTQFGYHIILVTEKTPQDVAPFTEVRDSIEEALSQIKSAEEAQVYIEGLIERVDVERFESVEE